MKLNKTRECVCIHTAFRNKVHPVRFALISELFTSRNHKVIVEGSKIENLIRNLRLKTQPDEGSSTHNYIRIRSLQVQSSAKHWQYFGSLKFEKTANVWTAKWARIFSKFLAEITIFLKFREAMNALFFTNF